ncbi:MAG TPA: efflux transporter outer membrane subunit [Steroidobacteraceae bacterium]|nr:efflux transporter outer membrane subunit [Steroidobacteraceae bacterium]
MRRACTTSLLLVALGALCACHVGPSFTRPATPTPSTYTAPAESQGAASPSVSPDFAQQIVLGGTSAAQWWAPFQSPKLDGLVRRAIAHNHTLAAARATLDETQELVRAEAGARYPQVSLTGGAGRQKYGKEFLGSLFVLPPFGYFAAGAAVSYTLDYTGGVARSIEQRQALAQYQRSEVDAAYLTLTGNVVTQAMIAASSQAQIDAVSELLAEDRDNVNLVRTAFENGSVSRVDVLTAQSQLASDETLLPPLRQQLAAARHALAVLAGEPPAGWLPPGLALADLRLPHRLPVSLPSQLVHRRPDILAAEAQLHAATAAVGVATANLYPQITLAATGGFQSLPFQQLFDRSNTAWTLLSGVTAPLYNGGTLRAERRAALDELRASAARYQEVVVESFGQVADLLDALSHDAELLATQSNALATSQASLELARESYAEGNSGVLQVIDAQRQRLTSQLGLVRAQAQQYLDTAQLFLALGGSPPD